MSIRNLTKNRFLKNPVLRKKNSAAPIAEHQFMKTTQNVNIAVQGYKKKAENPAFFVFKKPFFALICEIAKFSPLFKGEIANKNRQKPI